MKPHPIHENPICQAEQVGKPIPASLHAVSMCLPRWEDVIGYEERDPATLHQLQLPATLAFSFIRMCSSWPLSSIPMPTG